MHITRGTVGIMCLLFLHFMGGNVYPGGIPRSLDGSWDPVWFLVTSGFPLSQGHACTLLT